MRIGLVDTTDMTWDAQIYAMEENVARPGPYPVQGQRVLETGRRLIRMGHEVTIFTPYPCWGEDSEDVRELKVIHLTPVLPWLSHPQEVPLTPSLRHHIGRERLDIVHSEELHHPASVLAWSALGRRGPRLYIWQELDGFERGARGWMQHLFYLTLGQVMVKDCRMIPRSMSAERYLRKVGVPEDNIAPVVHTGVRTDVYRPMNKMDARIRFGLEEDRNVLLAIGQMKDREMMDRLFQALALLKVMNPDCLLIVRPPRSQAQLLQSMVSGMGLKDNVRIMAEGLDQADSVSLFNCADLFVISTYADYDALPAIEAISCGVPIATTYARGEMGDILNGGAGATLPTEAVAMAARLHDVLDNTVGLDQMGARARELAVREFGFEAGVERLADIYSRGR